MITIRFGVSNMLERPISLFPTVSSVITSPDLRTALGFGDNVEAQVNGVSGTEILSDGDVVDLVSRANTKGC